jgi:hypothetical protein
VDTGAARAGRWGQGRALMWCCRLLMCSARAAQAGQKRRRSHVQQRMSLHTQVCAVPAFCLSTPVSNPTVC